MPKAVLLKFATHSVLRAIIRAMEQHVLLKTVHSEFLDMRKYLTTSSMTGNHLFDDYLEAYYEISWSESLERRRLRKGKFTLSPLDVLQGFSFFLQIGFTLILATLDGLDVGLLGDAIVEDDCDDDG
ncbi:hypothetical protein Tco_0178197 [Tanacetum coccineum]